MKLPRIFIFALLLLPLLFGPAAADLADLGITPLQAELTGRPLGMGGAFVGLADDVNTALYNPAGLAWNKGVAVTGKDSDNLTVIQAYPNGNNSSFGLALLTNKITKIPVSTTEEANFNNTTAYVSYGTKLTFIPRLEDNAFFQRFGLGINIKGIVNQTLRRTGQFDRSATGWNLDFGMLWKPNDWGSVGANWQNILPAGVVKWDIGSSESMPSSFRLGAAAKIVGDLGSLIFIDGQELLLAGEVDIASKGNSVAQLGLEYGWFKSLYIRTGWQQQQTITGLSSDITYGLGYRNELWGCDFTSYREPANNQRYYAISLLYFPADWIVARNLDIEQPKVMLEQPIESISLKDNIITYDDKIEISGVVKPGVSVLINNLPVDLTADNNFKTIVPLLLKKNLIIVEARYQGEKKVWKYKVFRKARVYVPNAAQSQDAMNKKEKVEDLVTMGVIEVKPDTSFVMETGVTRGELASWLVKSADITVPIVTRDVCVDVSKDNPLAPFIKAAVDQKIMPLYADGTFRPDAIVSKKEGDAIFAKFGALR